MAETWKEAKKERKHEKKALKRERRMSKKHHKLERKMTKVQRKLHKKESKFERKLGISESPEFEPVQGDDAGDIPEFEVISEDVTVVDKEIVVPDLPVDTSRIPEIERKMDYLMGGESGVTRRFKEKYGESLDVPVGPQVKVGRPEQISVPDVPETTPEEPVQEAEAPAEEKKAVETVPEGDRVPFFAFTRWKFLQSRVPKSNILFKLILPLIDLGLLIIRIPLGIVVMILKKVLSLVKRKPKGETAGNE